jgi:ABC-type nickel/cobalt efflux system permease component RcnA
VIRALITAALLTGAAVQFVHADPYTAAAYSIVISLGLWFLWPLLRRIARLVTRRRGGRRRQPARASKATAPAPHLTQVNHYYFYGPMQPVPGSTPRPDYSRPALPRRTQAQQASDEILDTIDLNDETR